VVAKFRDNASALLADIHMAAKRRDANAVRLAAHALKGACGYVGASALRADAMALEHAARTAFERDTLLEFEPHLVRLQAEFHVLVCELDRFLALSHHDRGADAVSVPMLP